MACIALLPTAPARAEDGRDFAGQYAFSNVVDSNGTVTAMLTARIFNYSGQDVWGARVVLAGSQRILADNVGFANHTSQIIRSLITAPSPQFALWRKSPPLMIRYQQTDGSVVQRAVELIRMPSEAGVN